MKIKSLKISFVLFCLMFVMVSYGQEVVRLYNGEVPAGSEVLTKKEYVRKSETGEVITYRNVSMPTLTIHEPAQDKKNGIAMVICPGGGFTGLAFNLEGTNVAKWCNDHGITAFILKYRLMPLTPEVMKAQNDPGGKFDSLIGPYVKLAVADGLEAVKYVRSHANEYGIDANKIGIMGFSAGGTVAGSVAQTYNQDSRPDFVAPIYAYCPAILGDAVPDDAPPMFQTLASDDHIANWNPGFYEKWRDAGKSVEMHCFYSGGHGFAMEKTGKASDKWVELFYDWLVNQGFLTK